MRASETIAVIRESVFALVFILCALTVVDNWPQWRGPRGQGVSDEKNLPLEWSPTKNIKWKTPIPGRGHSSPIVWGNRLFLTTAIEGPIIPGATAVKHVINNQVVKFPDTVGAERSHALKLICVDIETGKIMWERTAYEGRVYDDRQKTNSYASSTPATDGRYVYAFFGSEGLYCYDFDGNQVWKATLPGIAKMGYGEGTSPILFENLVILQVDTEMGDGSHIAAFDKTTGKQVWQTRRKNRASWSTPVVVQGSKRVELIASGSESVTSYDPATGKELWQTEGLVSHAIPTSLVGDDIVFVYAGSHDKRGYAVRVGESTKRILWRHDKGTAYVASGVLYNGTIYLITDSGTMTALDAKTGELKYEGGRLPAPSIFFASPVAFDGKILLTSQDGDSFLITAGVKHELLGTNSIGEPVYASPAISGGRIFIRAERHLYCIGK
ncbi:MAG TPA: PQQ-binding-like beta-propeller repeat protein [Pyrinomonadaceae bacterium]|nr:PQQ-binding-like beta-propeller repeat protein [Pyrinomonadaceae bacterium]